MTRLPPVSETWLNWFAAYSAFYLRRNFHGFSLLRAGQPEAPAGWPLLVCLNHPSWWDPLTTLYLIRDYFPSRRHYAPMAADGLAKYKFFQRLGFFGIDMQSYSGAATFLKTGKAILQQPDGVLWVTPQGSFRDVRERPVVISAGVGHLARRLSRFAMLPLALEYGFWNERGPEAFACFGPPLLVENGRSKSAEDWTKAFAAALEAAQDLLSQNVMRRDPQAFMPLLKGKAGVGGVYDIWRRTNARLRGRKFQPEHGGT